MNDKNKTLMLVLAFILIGSLVGCGGGGSDGGDAGSKSNEVDKVTISGVAATGTSPTVANQKGNFTGFFISAVSGNLIIQNGILEVFSKTGQLLATGNTRSDGSFSIDVAQGDDYFLRVISSDGETVVRAYIPNVSGTRNSDIVVNAYSSAIVYAMESFLNTTFTDPNSGGYSGNQALSDLSSQIISATGFIPLVTAVQSDMASGNGTGLSNTTMSNLANLVEGLTDSDPGGTGTDPKIPDPKNAANTFSTLVPSLSPVCADLSASVTVDGGTPIHMIVDCTVGMVSGNISELSLSLHKFVITYSVNDVTFGNVTVASESTLASVVENTPVLITFFHGNMDFPDEDGDKINNLSELLEGTDPALPQPFKHVSSRGTHSCAIRFTGSLWCWGINLDGQLGDNTTTSKSVSTQEFTRATDWESIFTGGDHTCALKTDGSLWCWGSNRVGQLGDNTTTTKLIPTREFTNATDWESVSLNRFKTCGLKTNGSLWCWGGNVPGLVGDNPKIPTQEFTNATDWRSVSTGFSHTCAVKTDGTLWCWGSNFDGQLGDNTTASKSFPTQEFTSATDWASVSAGSHTCAVKTNSSLWCWGGNWSGQLGDNTTQWKLVPIREFTSATDWASVLTSTSHTCALKIDGSLWCWGHNFGAQHGDNTMIPTREFTNTVNWASISISSSHICGLIKTDGSLWCWGNNGWGQLGISPSALPSLIPAFVDIGPDLTAVSAGENHTCALKMDGELWCWGANWAGQLLDGTAISKSVPTQEFSSATGWVSVSAGSAHTCSIFMDRSMGCGGSNTFGQLGLGEFGDLTPESGLGRLIREFTNATDWGSVSTGFSHTCAVKTEGSLWCWGNNGWGKLGDNTTINKSVPTREFTNSTDWESVSAGSFHTCGVKTDGSLWCWGGNPGGQLGDNTTINKSVPTREFTNSTDWASVSIGDMHTCAVKISGSLWCWGDNRGGFLGDNTTINKSVPTREFTNATDWASVSAGGVHTCAVKTDGSLWCWGENDSGQLGDNTMTKTLVPTREVTSAMDWATVSSSMSSRTCAVKKNGSLWCWGENGSGELGNGAILTQLTPGL